MKLPDRFLKLAIIFLIVTAFLAVILLIFNPFGRYSPPKNATPVSLVLLAESKPSITYEPYSISMVNLSDSTFGIFFRTAEKTSAYVQIGQNKVLDSKIQDRRDKLAAPLGKYYNHYFEFSDPAAIAKSEYQFRIVINEDKVYDNDGNLYKIQLPPLLSSPPVISSLDGYLSVPEDPKNNDVFLIAQDASEESTYVGSLLKDRVFIQSLGTMRNIEKTAYANPVKLTITVFAEDKAYKTEEFLDFDSDNLYNLVVK